MIFTIARRTRVHKDLIPQLSFNSQGRALILVGDGGTVDAVYQPLIDHPGILCAAESDIQRCPSCGTPVSRIARPVYYGSFSNPKVWGTATIARCNQCAVSQIAVVKTGDTANCHFFWL